MLLRPSLECFDPWFVTTNEELGARDNVERLFVLPDSNRHRPMMTIWCVVSAWRLVRRLRPDFVVSTGALPGLICVVIGRLLGAKAIWVDSIANSERSSMSGWFARWVSSLSLTQWEHLARPSGPHYKGALL